MRVLFTYNWDDWHQLWLLLMLIDNSWCNWWLHFFLLKLIPLLSWPARPELPDFPSLCHRSLPTPPPTKNIIKPVLFGYLNLTQKDNFTCKNSYLHKRWCLSQYFVIWLAALHAETIILTQKHTYAINSALNNNLNIPARHLHITKQLFYNALNFLTSLVRKGPRKCFNSV